MSHVNGRWAWDVILIKDQMMEIFETFETLPNLCLGKSQAIDKLCNGRRATLLQEVREDLISQFFV